MTTTIRTIATAALALAATALALQPLAAGDRSMTRSVTVSASADITAKPDAARIQSGVQTEADTANDALTANTQAMSNLIDGLKALGIDPRDIQTTSFNVNPRYTHHRDGRPPEINGYQVNNEVSVFIRKIEQTGDILDKMVALGANQMRGLNFIVTGAETLKDEARRKAVENARRRAELFAKAAGAEVGEVIEIQEGGSHGPSPRRSFKAMESASAAAPIESGEATLSASVTVTWELK